MKNKQKKYNCPVETTLGLIGGKYKVLIIWYLYNKKVLRYGELQKILNGITPKMLIAQLRGLEEDKLIQRKVYPVVPPKVEYRLSKLGESIIPVIQKMKEWGEYYLESAER